MIDYLVIGAGIVGLATAHHLKQMHPHATIVVLEKEGQAALHQTGRNSGVVHSGVYYKPGSLKAKNCKEGRQKLLAFCDETGIPYKKMHKVILASSPAEEKTLGEIFEKGKMNGVPGLALIGPCELKEIEPHASATRALFVPDCAIIDYKQVADTLARHLNVQYNTQVLSIDGQTVNTSKGVFKAKKVINCAGLYSDRLAKRNRILPFRGEYYELTRTDLVKGLIYPVPDPRFPFLGVHLTPMMNGKVEAGPNAVLALARETYRTGGDWRESLWTAQHPGFWKMAFRYWKAGAYELLRSKLKSLFVKDLKKLVPAVRAEDLCIGNAGIRAQVVTSDGKLMDDFCFEREGDTLHVINAPSPAATASFAIGRTIAEMIG